METLFERFVTERPYLKNVTPTTVCWYWDSWRALGAPVLKNPASLPDKAAWAVQIASLRGRGVSAISINTYARAINAFLKWACDEGHLSEQTSIPRLKVEQKVIPTLRPAQARLIAGWKPRSFGGERLHALLCLLLDTGLRIEEALTLRREQIDLDNLLVTVCGKGQKQRIVPISLEVRRVLYRWILRHQFVMVFPTHHGTRLSQRNCLRDFKHLAQKVGIVGTRTSFHVLRHTFAVNYLRAGGNVFYLQRILGHSTLEMTNRYVRSLGIEDLQAAHNRLSLLSRS
jgi:site-specific recombinase XerD